MHTVAAEVSPAVEKPAAHSSHFVWPELLWYRPVLHFEQDVAPEAFCTVPATQLAHSVKAAESPYLPLKQSVQDDAAAPEYVPVGQSVQFDDLVALNVPLSQLVHELAAPLLKVPLKQSEQDDAAAPEYVPVGHAEHDVARPKL